MWPGADDERERVLEEEGEDAVHLRREGVSGRRSVGHAGRVLTMMTICRIGRSTITASNGLAEGGGLSWETGSATGDVPALRSESRLTSIQ